MNDHDRLLQVTSLGPFSTALCSAKSLFWNGIEKIKQNAMKWSEECSLQQDKHTHILE